MIIYLEKLIKELESEHISIKILKVILKMGGKLKKNVPDIDGFVHGLILKKYVAIRFMKNDFIVIF